MKGAVTVSADTEAMLNARIAEIDQLLSDQLNAIMHDPEFQKLEASWRGLHYLVDRSETSTKLQIRVMHATKKELLRDMEKAKEFDQSVPLQENLRGRVWRLRRRAVRSDDRRLRVRQAPPGHRPLEADFRRWPPPPTRPSSRRPRRNSSGSRASMTSRRSGDLSEIFRTRDYDK